MYLYLYSPISYLHCPLLSAVLLSKVSGGNVLILAGAEVSLPGGSPVADHGGVVVRDVLDHLPLVVDEARHHTARVVHQHRCKLSVTGTVTH